MRETPPMPSNDPRDVQAPDRSSTPGRAPGRTLDQTTGRTPDQDDPRERLRAREAGERSERGGGADALTRPPGAHPVGIGAGAAAGGTAGAILGAAAGPVGAVVGGALGAFAGGYIGREAAEAVNPTVEDRYWAEAYASRPYVIMGETYEYYRPAYHFGWDSYRRAAMRGVPASFEEAEPTLAANWAAGDASATLPWERARPAARDAWNRVARQGNDEVIELLEGLREACLDSARGLRVAADGIGDPASIDLLDGWAGQRESLADELAVATERLGAEPGAEPIATGPSRPLWMNVRDAVENGPHAVLSECENNEGVLISEYDNALGEDLPAAAEAMLRRHVQVVRVTHDQVRALLDATPG